MTYEFKVRIKPKSKVGCGPKTNKTITIEKTRFEEKGRKEGRKKSWTMLGDIQGLFLSLSSGITPGSVQGILCDAEDLTKVNCI